MSRDLLTDARITRLLAAGETTPGEASRLAKLGRNYLQQFLANPLAPEPSTALADVFGVSLDYLLRGEGRCPSDGAIAGHVAEYRRLHPVAQRAASDSDEVLPAATGRR